MNLISALTDGVRRMNCTPSRMPSSGETVRSGGIHSGRSIMNSPISTAT